MWAIGVSSEDSGVGSESCVIARRYDRRLTQTLQTRARPAWAGGVFGQPCRAAAGEDRHNPTEQVSGAVLVPATISENTAAGLPPAFAARSDQQARKVARTLCGRIAPQPIGAV
jgi:hypothetical protein